MYKDTKRKTKFWLKLNSIFSILIILFGASLIFWVVIHQGYGLQATLQDSNKIDHTVMLEDQKTDLKLDPVRVSIFKLKRELEVSDGYVLNNRWTISSTGVSYLTTSGKLGQKGNVVLYGHNTRNVLGGLWRVQNGDVIEVFGEDGKVYKYEIFERKEVKPNAVEILNQTDDARLTIYTCSGFLDTARFVVVGKLVENG